MRTQQTISMLNRLIRTCRDTEALCRALSERTDPAILLRYRSEEWGRLGDELQALVLMLGGVPATTGTPGAYARQMWLIAKARLLGPGDMALIKEQCRAQRCALESYEQALRGYLPERIRRTVSLQAERIVERCEQLRNVCDPHALHSQGA